VSVNRDGWITSIPLSCFSANASMNILRISAKNLGALAMPDFCPRCFWLKMKCREGLPFQIFPGIFSSIDSYTKKVTNCCYEESRSLPVWFEGFGGLRKPMAVPHHSEFFIIDPETGIRLTGVPDEIIERTDGSYFIVDYKTAKFTGTQDNLMPIYTAQLNSYAFIAERRGLSPVTGLGLIYYEPQTELQIDSLESVQLRDGFLMRFRAKLLEITSDAERTVPCLLKRMRDICDRVRPPATREGCRNCVIMDDAMVLLGVNV
jgi:hypothetical protein